MTTDTTAPVTLTRYGVIAADEALAQAVDGHPYRTIRIDMTITEEGTER